ncbi:MAG TPA: CotH kinase family protein, partial [Candidatus Acidoferrum sp.]|nr:CotH kinase family protein [Candidatus Acidoferrum sp.]
MRAKTALTSLLLAAICFSTEAASPFAITEFMSANTKTYRDENNAFSDWIEIYNTTSTTQNLGGWYLTDDAGQLNKWQFPATNVGPNGFVIVFASSKDRRVAGAPLHANFALGAGGEYLALLQPNFIKASEFPDSLEQFPDVPFGFLMPGVVSTNIATGAGMRALVPSADIGTAWHGTNFDDSAWTAGVTGVGYDSGTNYNGAIGFNIGAAMSNVNASAYVRVPFDVSNPSQFKLLTLRMRYDDGFAAYLNGTEVLRRNAPAALAWNSAATNYHGGGIGYSMTEDFEGAGNNYTSSQLLAVPTPAVQAAGAGSTGKFMRLLTDGANDNINVLTFRQTAPGLFQTIVAEFDFRITDVSANPADGFSFMLIPTATYGTNGAGHISTSSPFEEPNYAGIFAMGFDVYPHATANDVSLHWNGAEKINVTMPAGTLELVASQFHRVKLILEHVPGGARVTVTFRANINGTPGAAYTPITNFFIADLNPFDCRLEFAGRTGGANMSVDLDNLNVQFVPPAGALGFEEFNISSALTLLKPGSNVLAIQGLNLSATDTNFLISPELIASGFELSSVSNYISPATPGTWNNVQAAGTLPPVVISPASGVHTNSVAVTISSSSSSAQIRYTLNGTEPTDASPLYTAPLTFTVNTAIRARAFEAGKISGPINGANYVLLDNSMTNFTSNLPLIVIDTMGANIGADSKVIGYGMFFDTNANGARVSMKQKADHAGRVAVEIAGQSSTQFPKKSYNLELRGEQEDDDQKVELLGLPRGSDWRLYAPYTDKTLMNDFLTYELHEAMGHYSVRRKFVEVFVRSTAGKLAFTDYLGVYVLLEKIRIDPERVDINKPQSGSPGDPITGGYIFKRDKGTPGDIEFK